MSNQLVDFHVIIVGAGVAGASAAYHLTEAGVGLPSVGGKSSFNNDEKRILVIDEGVFPGEGPGLSSSSRKSGSAVMDSAPVIKMMVQIFSCSTQTFVSHHGEEGATRYLRATAEGLELQKKLARKVIQSPSLSPLHDDESIIKDPKKAMIQELGSLYVGYKHDETELRAEFEALKRLGGSSCEDIEWYDKERLASVDGFPSSSAFHCAIFFPRDAVIDSSSYAKGLLNYCQNIKGSVQCMMGTKVERVSEQEGEEESSGVVAVVELESGRVLRSNHVVMATGGLSQIPELCGILKPCYSYLVHVPVTSRNEQVQQQTSPNFFTWGFSHDWCVSNGKVRTSGEDHYSAYKEPKTKKRCGNLIRWTLEKYGCDDDEKLADSASYNDIPQQHGVYSETPDGAPLIGSFRAANSKSGTSSSSSRSTVCYLVGCNAWGQTVLSYTSSLVPALLGYTELTDSQRDSMKLFSIRRFCHLPAASAASQK